MASSTAAVRPSSRPVGMRQRTNGTPRLFASAGPLALMISRRCALNVARIGAVRKSGSLVTSSAVSTNDSMTGIKKSRRGRAPGVAVRRQRVSSACTGSNCEVQRGVEKQS